MFRSIRVRLTLWYALTVAVTFVIIAWATYQFFYPITPEKRKEMSAELAARRAAEQTELA